MSAAIRYRNLYFMLLYAWHLFSQGLEAEVAQDDGPDELNLFAKLLERGVKRLLRRGLGKGYSELHEDTSAPRGRFLLSATIGRSTLANGRAVCEYTELTSDTDLNRIVKATMRVLSRVERLDAETAHQLQALCRKMDDVADVSFGLGMLRGVRLSANSRDYLLLLRLCELVARRLMPGEGDGQTRFASILEDEVTMSTVFESFLRNFLRAEQNKFSIAAAHVPWSIEADVPEDLRYIPAMRTDITLTSEDETIIVDAKYYKDVLRAYRGGVPKLRSEHLYQIQSYLRHGREQYGNGVSGVLLYAATGEGDISLRYRLEGLPLRVMTLNLDRPWKQVTSDILAVVGANSRYH